MPRPEPAFTTIPIDRGVTLHHRRSDRFKTELARVFFRAPFDDRRTERHLFCALLGRGTKNTPSRRGLVARLQDLYGAGYDASAQRLAGRHVIGLRASTVSGRWLPGRPPNLESLLDFLAEAMDGPPVDGAGAPGADVFEQERRTLLRELKSRKTNKGRYALDRMREEMFAGHPFAHPVAGRPEDVEAADPTACVAEGLRVIREGEVDVYLLAPCPPDEAEQLVRERLHLAPRDSERLVLPELGAPRAETRRVTEALDVEQGKLVLGFRIADWQAFETPEIGVLSDVVLGGGPSSKLFRNVREAKSLCYDVRSSLDRVFGVWTVSAGIKPSMCEAAREAIEEQIAAMRAGDISEDEVETARTAILSGLRGVPDSQSGLVEFFHSRGLMGRTETSLEEVARGYAEASVGEIPALMSRVKLDTVYFLDASGSSEEAAHA